MYAAKSTTELLDRLVGNNNNVRNPVFVAGLFDALDGVREPAKFAAVNNVTSFETVLQRAGSNPMWGLEYVMM